MGLTSPFLSMYSLVMLHLYSQCSVSVVQVTEGQGVASQ